MYDDVALYLQNAIDDNKVTWINTAYKLNQS